MSSTDPFGGLGFRGLGVWWFVGFVGFVGFVVGWGGGGGARFSVEKALNLTG